MDAEARERYGEQTRRLVARRGPLCVILFAVSVGLADFIEYHYHPERLSQLLLFSVVEVALCLVAIGFYRTQRLISVVVRLTHATCVVLLLCVTLYFCLTGANGSALAFVFIVFELTTALMFPWRASDQVPIVIACILFYCLYAAYAAVDVAGSSNTLPVAYGLYAVAAGGGLSLVGSANLDRQRFTVFAQRQKLDRHLAAFRDLTRASDGFNPQRVLLLACTSTLQVFPLRRLWAVWQDSGGGDLHGYFARREGGEVILETLPDPQPLWGTLSLAGSPTDPSVFRGQDLHVAPLLRAAHVDSALFIPLRFEGETLGGMWADSDGEPFQLGEQELELASVLASGAAIAVANARLYQEAAAASEEKSTFLARIAHELRNPLHTLLWDIDTLQKQAGGPDKIIGRLRQNALMTLDVSKELQEFAELETKRLTTCPEPISLAPVFDELRATAVALLDGRQIAFTTHVAAGAEVLITDPFRLRQILGNLLSNATKFTARGTIEVDAQRLGDEVVISVRDTGVGIEDSELAKIFTPFYRGSARVRMPTRGVGLGLAIAQEIANLLGGRIEVESRVGMGSTFRLLLPVGDVATRVVPQGKWSAALSEAAILLIEDDERCRARMADVLRRTGARIIEASDGLEGISRAREQRPDVVVLDLGLPGLSGIEVLARMKDDRLLAEVPVVVAAGDSDEHLQAQCREGGCAAYIVKGHTPDELLQAVVPLVNPQRSA
jgi:signal transduction histidine kinase/CheY-like chemotaxis protein